MDLYNILEKLIIGGLLYWLVTLIPLPAPFPQVIRVVVIVALVLWLGRILLGF